MLRNSRGEGLTGLCRLTIRAAQHKNCSAVAREHLVQRGVRLASPAAGASNASGVQREISYKRRVPRLTAASHSVRVASATPVGTRLLAFQWEYVEESERVGLAGDFETGLESDLQLFVQRREVPACARPEPTFILLPGAPRASARTIAFWVFSV